MMKSDSMPKATSIIPGLDQLSHLLEPEQLAQVEKAAERHFAQSNITFTILAANKDQIEIEVLQGDTRSGKYATEATLTARATDLFTKFLPQTSLHINPVTFAPSPASTVTTAWLEAKMQQKGIRIKQIAFDTGIDKESISDWVTGKKSMSQIVKAMFYYYFAK